MCCGPSRGDVYDLVVVAESESTIAAAFAEAFIARDGRERVAVVLPGETNVRRLSDYLDLSEITLVRGAAELEGEHHAVVRGRRLEGARVVRAVPRAQRRVGARGASRVPVRSTADARAPAP